MLSSGARPSSQNRYAGARRYKSSGESALLEEKRCWTRRVARASLSPPAAVKASSSWPISGNAAAELLGSFDAGPEHAHVCRAPKEAAAAPTPLSLPGDGAATHTARARAVGRQDNETTLLASSAHTALARVFRGARASRRRGAPSKQSSLPLMAF